MPSTMPSKMPSDLSSDLPSDLVFVRSRLLLLAALLTGTAFSACDCTEDLGALPAPSAVLVAGQNEAPPLDHLTLGVAPVTLGQTAAIDIVVRNDGNADLNVVDVIIVADPELCPAPSGAFTVTDPAAPRAFVVKQNGERAMRVTFAPTSGQPSCAVVEVISDDKKHPKLHALITGQGDAAQLCTARSIIDFGEVLVGERKDDVITVRSCGTRPAEIGAMTLNAQFPNPFTADPTTPAVPGILNVDEVLSIPVHFAPLVPGTWSIPSGTSGAVALDIDAGAQTYRIDLVGTSREPPRCALQVIPSVVQFGSVGENRTSTQNVLIRNIGALECTLTSADVVEATASFSRAYVDLSAGMTLPSGQGGTLTVTFAPTAIAGVEHGVLRVLSSDPVNPTVDVPLEGTSVEVQPCFLEASPTAVNFGFQPVFRSVDREVTLTNVGTEDCVINTIDVNVGSPPFTVIEPAFTSLADTLPPPFDTLFGGLFGAFVPVGDSVTFVVTYRPETAQPHVGNVHFVYKELGGFGNPEQNIDVPTGGTGVAPCIQVVPQDKDFGVVAVGANATQNVDIFNCGGADLFVRGVGLRAGSHPDFSLANVTAQPSVIAPGATQTLTVRAAPTTVGVANAGAAMFGFLDVLTDTAPAIVSLRANTAGACTEGLQCVPQTIAFGDVFVGDTEIRTVACSNPGTTAVAVSPSIVAPFEIISAPASVAPGTTGLIRVRFTSNDAQAHTATLNTGANTCAGAVATIAVNARGVNDTLPPCPTPTTFSPQATWEWDGGSTNTASKQVWVTPLVARLSDTNSDGLLSRDDMPSVVFISFNHNDAPSFVAATATESFNDPVPGVLRAVRGDTGAELWTTTGDGARLNSSVTPAIVDLDGDGCLEIIGSKYVLLEGVADIPGGPKVNGKFARGNLIAFDCHGAVKWESQEWTRASNELEDGGGVAVGDMDGDGFAEVAFGDTVFDHNGMTRFKGGRGSGSTGHGSTSVLADVDGIAGLELVAGPTVYRADGTILWDRLDALHDATTSVADLDGNGTNEVVLRNADLIVLNGQTGATLAGPLHPPTRGTMGAQCESGPPVEGEDDPCNIIPTNTAIMDIDGDGELDIAVAAEELMIAYHRNLTEIYRGDIYDGTGASGPVGFDFEADGAENVVYSDEGNVWSWTSSGQTIYQAPRQSVTMFEYASVADIDNDGHANVLVGSNEPVLGTADGLDAWENTGTSWAHARGIWNQHAYAEELVSELGTPNWVDGPMPLKGFRRTSPQCIP